MKAAALLAAALVAVGVTAQNPTEVYTSTYTGTSGLNEAAMTQGKYMGTACNMYAVPIIDNDTYVQAELANTKDWGMLTTPNLMKMGTVQPNQGNFTFELADKFVAKAKSLGYKMRCHTLLWHNFNPDWLTKGTWTNATLLAVITDHITAVMTHFGDDCYAWDVVNDPLADSGGYRTSIWYNTCGESYIAHAFNVANEVKTKLGLKVKLYFSDYSLEWSGSGKATLGQTVVKGLLAQGVKIDGVGLQGHFEVGQTPSKTTLLNVMKVYTDLGLDVAITQLDIRAVMPPSMDAQQEQAVNFANVVSSCVETPKCVGVTVWDFIDSQSWVPSVFKTKGWALLFYQPNGPNTPMVRKGAYDAMMDAWSAVIATDPPETETPVITLITSNYTGTIGLNDAAKNVSKYMGSASDIMMNSSIITDTFYMTEFNNTKDWGMFTPGNCMKPAYLQPTQGAFTYDIADKVVALTKALGFKLRCHTLLWHTQVPKWWITTIWTNETLLAALGDHITNVMTHFKDDCYAWDVVNEIVSDSGDYRNSFWYKTCGASYIAHAFNVANHVKTSLGLSVKLYYNDYSIEWAGSAKTTFAQNMVKGLLDQGVKIDGVGLQAHFEIGATPSKSSLMSVMKFYTDLGLDVAVTELDIRTTLPASVNTQQQQVADFASVVGACKETAKCVGVSLWDFDDTYSWIPYTFQGKGWALPFYQPAGRFTALVRKGGYDGILQGWGVNTTTPAVTTTAPPTGGASTWGQCHAYEWLGVGAASAIFLLA